MQTERCHSAGWQPSQLFIGKQLAALRAGTGLGQNRHKHKRKYLFRIRTKIEMLLKGLLLLFAFIFKCAAQHVSDEEQYKG